MERKTIVAIVGAVVIIVIVVVVVPLVLLLPRTGQFRATFTKRCEKFLPQSQSCANILGTFEEAYVQKEPCNFPEKDYDPLFDRTPFTHSRSTTMLWSETDDLVHDFTKKSDCFITLEDTLLGSVLNGLCWCGKKGSKETFTKLCKRCETNPVSSFWKRASARFAKFADGEVTAMLNGGKQEPYNPKSIFASIEIPNLEPSKVKLLNIVLVTDKENAEKCNSESLQNLKNDLNQKGIGHTCKVVTRSHIRKCIKENKTCGGCW